MKKKVVLLLAAALLVTGCGKIPKLENGQDAVVTFKNGDKISVDELYEEIKNTYGLQSLINLADKYVLENSFKGYKKEAEQLADSNIETMLSYYNSEDELLNLLQAYYGISSIEDYKANVYLSYMQSHATEEYSKTLVSDDDIEDYYENEMLGDIEISHILIVPAVTDDMTDEEKEEAESTANKSANTLLKELKKEDAKTLASKFKTLAAANSDDADSKEKGGSLGKVNKIGPNYLGSEYDEIINTAYEMEDGTVYEKVIKASDGYHIIYKSKTNDKDELKNVKDTIKSHLAENIVKEDSTITAKAMEHYRSKLGMKIEDTELSNQFANYMQNQLAPKTSQSE